MNSGLRKGPGELIARFGEGRARLLWQMAEEAKSLVRERIERHAIDCDFREGNLLVAYKRAHFDHLEKDARRLAETFGYPNVRVVPRDELRDMLASERYHGGVLDIGAGHLHPLKLALGLARAAEEAGVRLHESAAVTAIEQGGSIMLKTARAEITAEFAVICCNAYLGGLVPEIAAKIMPIRNHVIATERLGKERALGLIRDNVAVCDTKFVVDYYRLSADWRLLFGGGETYSRQPPHDIRGFVRPYMLRVFPQLADVAIDYGWEGEVAITLSRLPHFGRRGNNLYFTHGFSGQGVAMTSLAGKLVAEAIAGQSERFDIFAGLPVPEFPGGTLLRRPAQVLGMLYYALRDRL